MSKRDELKKLRNAQKTVRSNDTPAEDYSKNAAEALAAEAKKEEATTVDRTPEPATPPTMTSSIPVSAPAASITPAPTVMAPQPSAPAPAATTLETPVEAPAPASVAPVTEQRIPTEAIAAEQPIAPAAMVSPAAAPEILPQAAPSRNYSIANEPGKRISVSLRTENKNWMHRTAMRCGLSIQDYINVLITEAWDREQAHPYIASEDEPLPERIPSSKTVLVAIKLTNDNIDRTKRMRASHCMTMTYYMNYLIEEEMKREQNEGMRRPVFDE